MYNIQFLCKAGGQSQTQAITGLGYYWIGQSQINSQTTFVYIPSIKKKKEFCVGSVNILCISSILFSFIYVFFTKLKQGFSKKTIGTYLQSIRLISAPLC